MPTLEQTKAIILALAKQSELLKDIVARQDHHEVEICRLLEMMTIVVEQLREMSGHSWEEMFAAKGLDCPPDLQKAGVFRG